MGRQIEHLVEMSQTPGRLDPGPAVLGRAHIRRSPGPFVHLEFPAENDPDVIFVENTLGDTLFRDDQEITAEYREQFWNLEDLATTPESFEQMREELRLHRGSIDMPTCDLHMAGTRCRVARARRIVAWVTHGCVTACYLPSQVRGGSASSTPRDGRTPGGRPEGWRRRMAGHDEVIEGLAQEQ